MVIEKSLIVHEDLGYAEVPLHPACSESAIQGIISLQTQGDMSLFTSEGRIHRYRFFQKFGINPDRVIGLHQIHSTKVITATAEEPSTDSHTEGDGLLTCVKNIIPSVTVADCLPIFLVDTVQGCFGILHSGWKGTGIAEHAVQLMEEQFGTEKHHISATIGPGIGSCCYDVDTDRYRLFDSRFHRAGAVRRDGKGYLDLRGANIRLLAGMGISDVVVVSDCTCCSSLLGSYRRDGEDRFQLMAAAIGHFPARSI